jgi:cytochrome c peroxidase
MTQLSRTLRSALQPRLPALLALTLAAACAHATGPAAATPAATKQDLAWRLGKVPSPASNPTTPAKVALGKILFFDPRLSGNGTMSCATCHNPSLGWSDGLKTGIGINGHVLARGTPTIVNTGANTQFMWDGRSKSLEDQALGPMKAAEEMHTDIPAMVRMLGSSAGYRDLFAKAFPGQAIDETTVAKAIAAFERSVVSNDSRFDRWLAGDRRALSAAEFRGWQVFQDPQRGNCATCHAGPNFTDNGFHNLGIAKAEGQADEGRFKVRALASMKGAFKTPTLRDVELTAPYFHDGSAPTLMAVVEHYERGGDDKSNLSKDIRPLKLSAQDKEDLVAFMKALSGRSRSVALPALPQIDIPAPALAPLHTASSKEK